MRLIGKIRLWFAREHNDWTLEQWKKVMWSDESRFALFQSDGRIRVRREADEVMHPSRLVPIVQTCGGGAMIWGCWSWSGRASATLCAKEWGQLTTWIYWMTRLFHPWVFLPWWHGHIPRWQCQESSSSNCERVVQGAWDIMSPDLNPIENLLDVLGKSLRSGATPAVCPSHLALQLRSAGCTVSRFLIG